MILAPLLLRRLFWFTQLFIRCGGWIALIPLVISLSSTLGAITLASHTAQLAEYGVPATATVISKRIAEGSHAGTQERQRPADTYYITLRFTLQNAAQISAEHQVRAAFHRILEVGQTFHIRYLPENPDIRELYEGELASWSSSTRINDLAFAALGFVAYIWFAKTAIRATRARENVGMIIDAYVTHRSLWPPLFNRMQYQVGQGDTAQTHKTFVRPIWAYRGLKRGDKTRVAITSQGPYWAEDLFL